MVYFKKYRFIISVIKSKSAEQHEQQRPADTTGTVTFQSKAGHTQVGNSSQSHIFCLLDGLMQHVLT
jgi:hypothetical protein